MMDETGYRRVEYILAFGLSLIKRSEPSSRADMDKLKLLEPWHLVRLVLHNFNTPSLEEC